MCNRCFMKKLQVEEVEKEVDSYIEKANEKSKEDKVKESNTIKNETVAN